LTKSKKDVHNFPETSGTKVATKCQFSYLFRENEKIWFLPKNSLNVQTIDQSFEKRVKLFCLKYILYNIGHP